MEFDLSSTQRMMQQAARTFLSKECPTTRVRKLMASDTAFDPELWSGMAEQGWLGIAIDEQYGGLGQSAIELAVIAEEMGRACLPGPFVSHLWGASVLAECNAAGRERWLPALCAGERRATVALLEDPISWRAEDVKLSVESAGGALRLTGLKRLVGDAATSDLLLCVARHDAMPVIVAVESKGAGVTITPRPAMDATRKLYDVRLENVPLAEEAIVARGAEAEQALSRGTQMATLATCAELVGVMSWVLETSVEYVKTRKQFDRLVGSFQAIQQQCVDMLLWLESSRSATYYAAWALASGEPGAAVAVSSAKAYASDAAREVVNRGVQVHGGIGFTWEHDLQLYYKRAKSNEILLGDAIYQREQVARATLGA
jgi:alkylation response protein AidB-like acyl-CoA dehydrogenase